jgi:hypothetical protein
VTHLLRTARVEDVCKAREVVSPSDFSESSSPQPSPAKIIVIVLFFVCAGIGILWYSWVLLAAAVLAVVLFMTA